VLFWLLAVPILCLLDQIKRVTATDANYLSNTDIHSKLAIQTYFSAPDAQPYSWSLNYVILFCLSFDAVFEDLGIDGRI
jgi:hypothetical protein